MPEAPFGRATRGLTCLTIDPAAFGANREQVRTALAEQQIEARPVWKPLYLKPVFVGYECMGDAIAENLFARALCLPSGSNLTTEDLELVIHAIAEIHCSHPESVKIKSSFLSHDPH